MRAKALGAQHALDRRAADLHARAREQLVGDGLLGPDFAKRGRLAFWAAARQSHDLAASLQGNLRRAPGPRGVQKHFEAWSLAPPRAPLVDGADGAVEPSGHGSRVVALREQQDHPDALDQPMRRAGPANARKKALSLVERHLDREATAPHAAPTMPPRRLTHASSRSRECVERRDRPADAPIVRRTVEKREPLRTSGRLY